MELAPRTTYRTLERGRLDHGHVAMRLFQKAKKLGTWDPASFDLSADAADWLALSDGERDLLRHLASLFVAGEEAVTLDLLPLIETVAAEGRLEEEMYLTSFLWEEAKHVEFFDRFLREVAGADDDLHSYHSDSYRQLFGVDLPAAMGRLRTDRSPGAQADASVLYNMIVEGVLAETGYHAWYTVLRRRGVMPGTVAGIEHVQRDESRHIRYGVFLLSRLISEHGDEIWIRIQRRMMELLPTAVGVFMEAFATLEARHGAIPFALDPEEMAGFAMNQFQKRMTRLEKARTQGLEAILRESASADDPDHG